MNIASAIENTGHGIKLKIELYNCLLRRFIFLVLKYL